MQGGFLLACGPCKWDSQASEQLASSRSGTAGSTLPPLDNGEHSDLPEVSYLVGDVLDGLLGGEHRDQFTRESDGVYCHLDQDEVKVHVDPHLELDTMDGLVFLSDWMPIDEILCTAGDGSGGGTPSGAPATAKSSENTGTPATANSESAAPATANPPRATPVTADIPVAKKSEWTESEMRRVLRYAKETKQFPPEILEGSDFHVEFLYRHFSRLAPQSRCNSRLKSKWKDSIRKNLDVFSDSIGCMKCEPYSYSFV